MKKFFAFLLIMTLVLGLTPALAANESLGTITVWYGGSGEGANRVALYQAAKEKIEADYPGTVVDIVEVPYNDMQSRQLTVCRSHAGVPDVMSQSITWTYAFMQEDLLQPVDELLAAEGRDLLAEFNPAYFESMTGADGRIYGVPQSRTAQCLVYNKDMFEAAGIAVPTNWDELEAAAKALTLTREDGTKQYGFAVPGTSKGNIWFRVIPDIWSAGGEVFKDGKAMLNTPEAKEGIAHYCHWYLEGIAPDSTMENDSSSIGKMVAAGTVAMYTDNIGFVNNNIKDVINVGVALWPGKDGTINAGMGGWNIVMPKDAPNPKGAAVFINYVTNEEGMDSQLLFPALAASLNSDKWSEGIYPTYADQIANHVRELPALVDLSGAQDVLMAMVQSIMTGDATLDEAVELANEELQSILDNE